MGIIHGDHAVRANELRGQLCEKYTCPEDVLIADFTPGLSVHTGSGVVGLVILTA